MVADGGTTAMSHAGKQWDWLCSNHAQVIPPGVLPDGMKLTKPNCLDDADFKIFREHMHESFSPNSSLPLERRFRIIGNPGTAKTKSSKTISDSDDEDVTIVEASTGNAAAGPSKAAKSAKSGKPPSKSAQEPPPFTGAGTASTPITIPDSSDIEQPPPPPPDRKGKGKAVPPPEPATSTEHPVSTVTSTDPPAPKAASGAGPLSLAERPVVLQTTTPPRSPSSIASAPGASSDAGPRKVMPTPQQIQDIVFSHPAVVTSFSEEALATVCCLQY